MLTKKARHNLCFGPQSQEADYENKKGTIVSYSDVPILDSIRIRLRQLLQLQDLVAEGNKYYNINECGIGFHGDTERRIVIGVRVGATIPLHYQWFQNFKPIGDRVEILLDHGDVYFMTEKAGGNDWKKKLIVTLRHAAGALSFLDVTQIGENGIIHTLS